MSAELLLYALVAGGLVFWLRSILGTRNGEERDRSEAFIANVDEKLNAESKNAPEAPTIISSEDQIRTLFEQKDSADNTISIENKTAEAGLLDIAKLDKTFDVKFFLEAVQDVFVLVVEGFGKGDRDLLQDLLAQDVYNAFEGAITKREQAGEILSNEIHAINKARITEAKLENKKAFITVRFIAKEVSVTRDTDGNIISGNPDRTREMIDIWVFSRDTKSRDPRWFVVETREDATNDNDTIPNTK